MRLIYLGEFSHVSDVDMYRYTESNFFVIPRFPKPEAL
jgi:hypothetical protein